MLDLFQDTSSKGIKTAGLSTLLISYFMTIYHLIY